MFLHMVKTLASCLNKNGYWLSVVAFWNRLMAQLWPAVTRCEEAPSLMEQGEEEAEDESGDYVFVEDAG